MTDRGQYRAIRRVLLNGKDFRALPERARFAFLCLKLNVGPSGIEDWEPDALVVTLAAQMGASPDQIRLALDVLEHAGWIRREDNLIWIVGQLEHDPHVRVTDPKHRKSIQRHVAGLPNLPLRTAFVGAHETWFADPDSPVKTLARVKKGPSKAHRRPIEAPITSTEDREPRTENKPELFVADASPEKNWVADGVELWRAKVGDTTHPRLGKALSGCVQTHGWPTVRDALVEYAEAQPNGKPKKLEWFAEDVVRWIAEAREPVSVGGELTAKGRRLMGMAS